MENKWGRANLRHQNKFKEIIESRTQFELKVLFTNILVHVYMFRYVETFGGTVEVVILYQECTSWNLRTHSK